MRRVPHFWKEAYERAMTETDSIKVIGRIEYAMYALEKRYAEWAADPGTPAELAAIQKCISVLVRLIKQNRVATDRACLSASAGSSKATKQNVTYTRRQDLDYSSGMWL